MKENKEHQLFQGYFNQVDPAGIFFEENVDEYNPEIKELIISGIDFADYEAIKKELLRIFKKYFEGVEIKEDKILELATLINKGTNALSKLTQ